MPEENAPETHANESPQETQPETTSQETPVTEDPENKVEVKEKAGKISFSETQQFDEAGLVEKYRELTMSRMMCEKVINTAPSMIESTKTQIKIREMQIESYEKKKADLVNLLAENNVNFEERVKEIRDKYSEEEILEKSQGVIVQSKTEIQKVDGKFQITTTSLNDIDDVVIEIMSLNATIPDLGEAMVKESETLKKTEKRVESSQAMLSKLQEQMKSIKVFFATRHKNVDQLLDQAAQGRSRGKVAEKFEVPAEKVE